MTTSLNRVIERLVSFLSGAGYDRVGRAEFSCKRFAPAVEHFLFFDAYGPQNTLLNGDFGVRNIAAQEFAIDLVKTFGHPALRQWRHTGANECSMRFAFWRLIRMARVGWDIRNADDAARLIRQDLDLHLFRFVRSIHDLTTLLDRLIADEEPCPWFATNAANRAAQVILISRMLGLSSQHVQTVVSDKRNVIEAGLGLRKDPTPFLEEALRRAYCGYH